MALTVSSVIAHARLLQRCASVLLLLLLVFTFALFVLSRCGIMSKTLLIGMYFVVAIIYADVELIDCLRQLI